MDAIRLLETLELLGARAQPRHFQPHTTPLNDYNDDEFKQRFRMTKSSFQKLLEMIGDGASMGRRGRKPIPMETKVLITLRYLATGSFQLTTADTIGISQPSASKCISSITRKIASLAPNVITFPDEAEARTIQIGFYNLVPSRHPGGKPFPGVIGAVDGTHVKVLAPGAPNREIFRDRKGEISLNIQAICDHRLKFLDVVCRWPGSVHDSRMFRESKIMGHLEKGTSKGWLLGDSGYSLSPYLMTPLANPVTTPERNYNFSHIQTRNTIERSFGVLKKRFAVLGGTVRQDFNNTIPTIMACFVLHNFLINLGDEFEPDSVDQPHHESRAPRITQPNLQVEMGQQFNDGKITRRNLIQTYFI